MWTYIISFIAGALFPLALAGYGGHLATLALFEKSKKRHALIIIWVLAALGVAASGLQQYLFYRSDHNKDKNDITERTQLGGKLDSISRQLTELLRNAKTGNQQAAIVSTQDQVDAFKSSLGIISREGSTAPKKALIVSRINLENELITMMTKGQTTMKRMSSDPIVNAGTLQSLGYLSKNLADAITLFCHLEASIVNGMGTSQEEFRLATQAGDRLTKTLKSMPTSTTVVLYADMPLYTDSTGMHQVPYGVGLMVETTTTVDKKMSRQVFPTTRTGYYKRGMILTWEWQDDPSWGETWYRDPDTHEIKLAFSSSLDFVPRDVNELLLKSQK